MHLIIELFWIGLLVTVGLAVFNFGLTLVMMGIAGVFAAGEWAYNKVKGDN